MTFFPRPLPSPKELHKRLPLTAHQQHTLAENQKEAIAILQGHEPRLVIFAGPCSIHSPALALKYAAKIKQLAAKVSDRIFLVMRVFLEKPRTQFGWKGFLYDPFLDGSNAIHEGIHRSRALLLDIITLGVPMATEFLDPFLSPYHSDLITWGIIGARTSASQIHRQMASHLSIPIGFKNDTNGQVDNAIFGALAAHHPQTLIGVNPEGQVCSLHSRGNPHTHLILRGSVRTSNYDPLSIAQAIHQQRLLGLYSRLIIDCAHGNSNKKDDKQSEVFHAVLNQWQQGNNVIAGLMLESHLEGKHRLSLTDPCLDWETTAELIFSAYNDLKPLFPKKSPQIS
ncbi:MAG: 3-deoxy-7-phosphoheptulonate synthase [Chlamydiota bacterium]